MEKTAIFQSAKEEGELKELLDNLKKVFKIRYLVVGSFTFLFLLLKLIKIYLLSQLVLILLFLLLGSIVICDLLLRKTKLNKTVSRASIAYFIFQIGEVISILAMLHLASIIPFVGALVLVLVSLVAYFSYTRRKYSWAIIIFYTLSYVAIVTLEYSGILGYEDVFNIGANVARNIYVFILSLSTGALLIIIISLTMDSFAKKLKEALKIISKREEELKEAKGVLEIKVKARTRALEEEKASLEEKVKERTGELQERLEELERFHKLTVGRELKMVELKKEIETLKKELEKKS